MRELRTCDFCGSDAVGIFEVLPPELTPAKDQKRVVLCDHCEETLTDVISPLLTRLDVDADVDERNSSARPTQSGDVAVQDDAPAETGASATTASENESTGSVEPVDVGSADAASPPSEPADHDSPDAALDASESDDTSPDADTDRTGPLDDESAEDGNDTLAEPPQFRKVVRILQNREFPVERSDVEALASNAYDLDDEEVADIFDYAVERGLLVDDSGTLRKP